MRRRPGRWLKPLVGLTAGVLALAAAEVAVRLWIPVRDVGPSFSEYDPVYGKRLKADVSVRRVTPEFTMRLTTNSLGFRGPEPTGALAGSILFLGDSFTEGYGVDDGLEFVSLVREEIHRRYGPIPVLNAGVGGTGNGRWVHLLTRELERFKPRLVVLQLSDTDFRDNMVERMFRLDESGELEPLPTPPAGMDRTLQWVIDAVPGLANLHLVGLVRQARGGLGRGGRATRSTPSEGAGQDATFSAPHQEERLTHALVRRSVAICREAGAAVLLLSADLGERQLQPLERLAQELDVPIIAAPAKRDRADLYYVVDGHWTTTGNRHVAALVLDALEREAARLNLPAGPQP